MTLTDPQILRRRLSDLPVAAPLLARLGTGAHVYLVGGALRDLMLGREPHDLDLAVDGELAPVAGAIGTVERLHPRFETCTVAVDGHRYDLARTRTESYGRPGALPTVSAAGIDADLARRDFTVNAFALGLSGPRAGELLSVPAAARDLDGGVLRVLHDGSFIDDPTRLLRMARYATRLGFGVEPHTRALAGEAVGAGALATAGGARIGTELRLLGAEPDPVAALAALTPLRLDAAIAAGFGLRDEARADLARRALALLPAEGDRPALAIAVAALDLASPELVRLLEALAFCSDRRDVIESAVRRSAAVARDLAAARRPSQIAAAVAGEPLETVALAGARGAEAPAGEWLTRLRAVRLEIGGHDLIAAGIGAGPAIGSALAAALAAKLDGEAAGRDAELAVALRAATGGG